MKRSGFTLVELAIVLVILGLLVGGVLGGQALIKSATMRRVITEQQGFKSALLQFRMKYNCLAGDCSNATAFGFAGNGNENNLIDYNTNESYLVWNELGQAGLIVGSYVPWGSGNFDCGIGRTCPGSAYPNAAWDIINWDNCVAGWCMPYQSGNVLMFGKVPTATWLMLPTDAILSAIEAWQLDTKVDDGLPAKGVITTFYTNAPPCTDVATSKYDTATSSTNTAAGCAITFNNM